MQVDGSGGDEGGAEDAGFTAALFENLMKQVSEAVACVKAFKLADDEYKQEVSRQSDLQAITAEIVRLEAHKKEEEERKKLAEERVQLADEQLRRLRPRLAALRDTPRTLSQRQAAAARKQADVEVLRARRRCELTLETLERRLDMEHSRLGPRGGVSGSTERHAKRQAVAKGTGGGGRQMRRSRRRRIPGQPLLCRRLGGTPTRLANPYSGPLSLLPPHPPPPHLQPRQRPQPQPQSLSSS
eukprot:TRINITY_DN10689_c0_g1_i1.p1 TRINITY_DN10689_c0_g1~~TRINITY_DN10689_c0_g1_i1.p1  ORF type:complete len:242 (-),score=23.27 TRINITY_DN10689_c0_g1_i1:377-1102(-)